MPGVARDMALLPSPRTSDTNGAGHHGAGGMDLRTAVAEIPPLPTPAAREPGGTPEQYRERWRKSDGRESTFLPLSMAVQLLPAPAARDSKGYGPADLERNDPNLSALPLLLPTPRATDGTKGGPNQRGSSGDLMLPSAVNLLPTPRTLDASGIKTSQRAKDLHGSSDSFGDVVEKASWGEYEPAISRWAALTRPTPDPTKPNSKGNPKLSDEFDEWLMGLPAGWITDTPGITWNETLKACGNGVVPQQAVAAVLWLRPMAAWEVAA